MKPQDAWHAAYQQLELQLDRASFDTWLRKAVFLGYENGVYVVGVHSSYARDMLQHRLYRNVRRVLSDVCNESVEIRFEVYKEPAAAPVLPQIVDEEMPLFRLLAQQSTQTDEHPALHDLVQSPRQPETPETELNARYTFDRFIVHRANQLAYEAAQAVAEYPATVYNPFLIYGGVGLGKTHLLQSIAHECRTRGLRVVYTPSEVFMNDLIHAIRNRTTAMFRERYRSVDVLLVDDIQFISGKDTTQEEFFHTFNALVNFNKQIIMACDRHPRELTLLEDRLRSRFQGGLVVDVQPPEMETRMAILDMWTRERDANLSRDVLAMVAERAPNNIRELHGAFNQIVAQSKLAGGRFNLPHVENTLQRFTQPRERFSLPTIIERVAQQYDLYSSDLSGKKRTEKINQARQLAMYLCRELTECSLPQIGEALGGRSHTTVLHGCNKMAEDMAHDRVLAARVEKIKRFVINGK